MEPDEILTIEEMAALLKIHPKTVCKFLKADELQDIGLVGYGGLRSQR